MAPAGFSLARSGGKGRAGSRLSDAKSLIMVARWPDPPWRTARRQSTDPGPNGFVEILGAGHGGNGLLVGGGIHDLQETGPELIRWFALEPHPDDEDGPPRRSRTHAAIMAGVIEQLPRSVRRPIP